MLERMFNYENPVWQFMNRVADLIILNIMFFVFSIPLFTIGASWTALYYTTVKMARKEDTYVWKEFWISFKRNFKQATIFWIIFAVAMFLIMSEILMFYNNPDWLPKSLKILTLIAFFMVSIIMVYVFPLLSHFDNTNKRTFTNAIILSILHIPSTIWFLVLFFLPIVVLAFDLRNLIYIVFFGISLPAYIASFSWSALFKKYEPKEEDDEETEGEEDDEDDSLVEEENKEEPEKIEEKTDENDEENEADKEA